MKKLYIIIVSLAFFILFLSGYTIRISEYGFLSNPFFFGSAILLIAVTLLRKHQFIMVGNKWLTIIYFNFILFGFISSLLNQDLDSFLTITKLLILYLMTTFFISNSIKNITAELVLNILIASTLVVLLLSVIEYPTNQRVRVYSGLFDNTNSMGMLASTLFAASIILLFLNNRKLLKIGYGFLVFIAVYFISISGSRTSFLAVFLILCTVIFVYCAVKIKEKKLINLKSLLWGFPLLLLLGTTMLILFFDSQIYLNFEENIIQKFESKDGDLTSSRIVIWSEIISAAGMFGNEAGYIKNEINLTAHNSFFAIIVQYGWISGSFYILFWMIALITSIFKSITFSNERGNIISLVMILNYILLSTMEVLTNHSSAMVAMVTIGYLTVVNKQKKYQMKSE